MNEYMGLVRGKYEAKEEGFVTGGGSLHSCMTAHGPDTSAFEKATTKELKPEKLPEDTLAFMFESTYILKITQFAKTGLIIDQDYYKCWEGLKSHFNKE